MNDVVLFLQAMGEPEMAERVLAEHNRLEAFSDGLEKDCIDSAFQAGAASRDAEIQRLQMALADAEALELGTAEKNDQLRTELVKALAACKTKDEALEKACNRIEEYGFEIGEYWRTGRDALAVRSDDSALKAWLGEPVAWEFTDAFGTHYTEDRRDWMDTPGIESVTPLYSPKGLK